MTLSYNFGLTFGSIAAYLLDKILGPVAEDPCAVHMTTMNISTTATSTILATSALSINYTSSTEFSTTIFALANSTLD